MAGRIRLGFIGAGTTVQQVHLPRFAAMPTVELLAMCSQSEPGMRHWTRQYGIPEVLTDYRRLLDIAELDAVVIAVPSYLHADMAVQALRRGKHVLCERPLGLNGAEAEAVEQAAHESGRIFMQRLPYRFESESLLARSFIQAGHLGPIHHARATVLQCQARPSGWLTSRRKAGGGALLHLGLPLLDLLLWFLGYPTVERASAAVFQHQPEPRPVLSSTAGEPPPRPWERIGLRLLGSGRRLEEPPDVADVEDGACALLTLQGGASLVLEASWSAYRAADLRQVSLHGEQGGIELWPLRLYRTMEGVPVDITPRVEDVDADTLMAHHFIDCITKGGVPQGSAAEGRALMATLDQVYQAAHG